MFLLCLTMPTLISTDSTPDRRWIVAIRDQVLDALGKWVFTFPVENSHRMAGPQQLLDEQTADEQCSSDHQYFHRSALQSIVILESQVRDEIFAAHPAQRIFELH